MKKGTKKNKLIKATYLKSKGRIRKIENDDFADSCEGRTFRTMALYVHRGLKRIKILKKLMILKRKMLPISS